MNPLAEVFGFAERECIALIGSGGKTHLLWYLANVFRQQKVLVGPTTKMGVPERQAYDRLILEAYDVALQGQVGVSLLGSRYSDTKIASAPLAIWRQSLGSYDKVIMEADGSKQLPLKGWSTFEPVILKETTVTIGIIPIQALGLKVSPETIHRLPEFTALTGLQRGAVVDGQVLGQLLSHPRGLWEKAQGRRCLLLNQVETEAELERAKGLVARWPQGVLAGVDRVVAGSSKQGVGAIIWQNKQ